MTKRKNPTDRATDTKKPSVSKKATTNTSKTVKQSNRSVKSKTSPAAGSHHSLSTTVLSPQQRHKMIAEAAYYLAEHRGFTPGYETEDWLTAESTIDAISVH